MLHRTARAESILQWVQSFSCWSLGSSGGTFRIVKKLIHPDIYVPGKGSRITGKGMSELWDVALSCWNNVFLIKRIKSANAGLKKLLIISLYSTKIPISIVSLQEYLWVTFFLNINYFSGNALDVWKKKHNKEYSWKLTINIGLPILYKSRMFGTLLLSELHYVNFTPETSLLISPVMF